MAKPDGWKHVDSPAPAPEGDAVARVAEAIRDVLIDLQYQTPNPLGRLQDDSREMARAALAAQHERPAGEGGCVAHGVPACTACYCGWRVTESKGIKDVDADQAEAQRCWEGLCDDQAKLEDRLATLLPLARAVVAAGEPIRRELEPHEAVYDQARKLASSVLLWADSYYNEDEPNSWDQPNTGDMIRRARSLIPSLKRAGK
jgi:hypothetical protein